MIRRISRSSPSVGLGWKALARASTVHLTQRAPLSSVPPVDDPDLKLRADIKKLGSMLGQVISVEDSHVFQSVEKLRIFGRGWRAETQSQVNDPDMNQFDKMVAEVKTYEPKHLLGVARAFTHFLALANSAETHHRNRRLRQRLRESNSDSSLSPKEDSCAGSIKLLIDKFKIPPEEILQALSSQSVEIVLTAHPTEVNRRTMLQKHQKIQALLETNDRPDLLNFERREIERALKSEITSIWETDELRRSKPTPIDEAKAGLAIVEKILWYSVPNYLRKLNDVSISLLGQPLPIHIAPIKIASWMGGDRDGNPNVTPSITLEVSLLSRWMAATLFKNDIKQLREELSLKHASTELTSLAGGPAVREPYREVLKALESKLAVTLDWIDSKLSDKTRKSTQTPLLESSELLEPLMVIHRSLIETGYKEVADGKLVDTIRRVAAFGLSLMPLDIRQESTRHSEALDAITRFLGIGSYMQWDEVTRRNWLQNELASKRPLLPRTRDLNSYGFSPTVVDTLSTFELIAKLGNGSLGAYVISQCQQASDVLAVMLLQQDAGVKPEMRVVPLFETLDDLERSADTVDSLFSMPGYLGRISGKQEIMVGYSDSAKDAGRLAAAWAQYVAQEKMIKVAEKTHTTLTFFHGKGGTVGRGGNPALYKAILAHPPHTINGRFRVTEQGEMITQNLGQISIAERTLDLFSAGVLAERFIPRPDPKPEWRDAMARISDISCAAYRQIVRGDERFVPYFRTATPEQELANLNVGSRPAKRNPKGGVESLRAIPWVFAWTQTRLNLPAWLGVEDALSAEMNKNPELLKEMYKEWPWFSTLIDLLEMILVKSEIKIAENYDKQLVHDSSSIELGEELRRKMRRTQDTLLAVTGNSELQQNNPSLLRSLTVRNPYVDPLNIIQAEITARLRAAADGNSLSEDDKRTMRDALLVTINGIANGMRNSG